MFNASETKQERLRGREGSCVLRSKLLKTRRCDHLRRPVLESDVDLWTGMKLTAVTRREIHTKAGVKLPRKWTMLFWFTRGKELKSDRCGLVTLQYILQVEFVTHEWREWLINISQTRPDRTSVCWAIFDAVGLRKTWQYPSSEVGKCSEWGRSIWLVVIVYSQMFTCLHS